MQPCTDVGMSMPTILDLLGDAIPFAHSHGQDHFVEAITAALGLLNGTSWWEPMRTAPHDGTQLLVVFEPFAGPAYVTFARWCVPEPNEDGVIGKKRLARLEANGGYWAVGRIGKPTRSPARAWMPVPIIDPGLLADPERGRD
jgi:hypothetical protein